MDRSKERQSMDRSKERQWTGGGQVRGKAVDRSMDRSKERQWAGGGQITGKVKVSRRWTGQRKGQGVEVPHRLEVHERPAASVKLRRPCVPPELKVRLHQLIQKHPGWYLESDSRVKTHRPSPPTGSPPDGPSRRRDCHTPAPPSPPSAGVSIGITVWMMV